MIRVFTACAVTAALTITLMLLLEERAGLGALQAWQTLKR